MKRQFWAIIGVLVALGALFVSFQNFSYKIPPSRKPAAADDFNTMIEESQINQKDLANQLEAVHPPEKLKKDGLISKDEEMKRHVIEGSGETVVARESKPFFKDRKRKMVDDKKDLERISREMDSETP